MHKKQKKATHVSEYMGIPYKGHEHFKFVDVHLNKDNRLFLDPCLIELGQDEWCKKAAVTMQKYFDCLFAAIRTSTLSSSNLLAHAHEQNATKLGYGNGENGKGKTPDGLFNSLAPLFPLAHQIPTISKPEDIPLLVYKFGEDNLSDLLTNVLHDELYQFTATQMALYNVPPQSNITYYTFDANTCSWIRITRPSWLYNGKELLLVPKSIVRKRYLFCPRQFLSLIIIERMMKDNSQEDMRKIDIITNLPKAKKDWVYEKVIDYTQNNPDALVKYHKLLPMRYADKRNIQNDEFLDNLIYGKKSLNMKSA